jgi:hypothetical protein
MPTSKSILGMTVAVVQKLYGVPSLKVELMGDMNIGLQAIG